MFAIFLVDFPNKEEIYMSIFLIVVVSLLFFLFINKSLGNVTSLPVKHNHHDDEEDWIELPDEKAYYDETNLAIIELKKKIDRTGITKEDVEPIKQLKADIASGFQRWETIQYKLEELEVQRTAFITQGNFYPRDYAFDINSFKIEKERAREYQLNNPLKSSEEVERFIKDHTEKVDSYIEIKKKIDGMLDDLELYEKSLKSKKDIVAYYEKKQQLFIHIQNGELKKAKSIIKELKSKIKKVKSPKR